MKFYLTRQSRANFEKKQAKVELNVALKKIADESISKHLAKPEIETHKEWDRRQAMTSAEMFFVFARYMEYELNPKKTSLREATDSARTLKDIFARLYSC